MYAQQMGASELESEDTMGALNAASEGEIDDTAVHPTFSSRAEPTRAVEVPQPGVVVRRANWQIGKIADLPANQVKPFQPGDRFLAWRKRAERAKKSAERRGLKKSKGKGTK